MNNLNSILFEGVVTPAEIIVDFGLKLTVFEIASNRYFKNQKTGETAKEVTKIEVVAYNRLAEICGNSVTHGKHVRVVGRIRQDKDMIRIVADHIEFRPNGNKEI